MQKNKLVKENIVYLKESEAKAIGIYENSKQAVYIDGKLVDVVFVNEHDVLPATPEERKIYAEGSKIRERRESAKNSVNLLPSKTVQSRDLVVSNKKENIAREVKSTRKGFFKSLFQNNEQQEKQVSLKKNVRVVKPKSKLRSDIFTSEELEIIEGIISKSKKAKK